jgi:hypothetical protein
VWDSWIADHGDLYHQGAPRALGDPTLRHTATIGHATSTDRFTWDVHEDALLPAAKRWDDLAVFGPVQADARSDATEALAGRSGRRAHRRGRGPSRAVQADARTDAAEPLAAPFTSRRAPMRPRPRGPDQRAPRHRGRTLRLSSARRGLPVGA